MSATLVTPKTLSGGEIITHLINATDGEGLHFDGAAGTVGNVAAPDLGTKFSVELILQFDGLTNESFLVDFTNTGRWLFELNGSDQFNIYDTTNRTFSPATVPETGKPMHLVCVQDGTSATLYRDGNQIATATTGTPTVDNCSKLNLGNYEPSPGVNYGFDGTMYRARLWNKALTQAEVTASYENATVPFIDQYGDAANLLLGIDSTLATAAANVAVFNAAYGWQSSASTATVVASNVLSMTSNAGVGLWKQVYRNGKNVRFTFNVTAITGTWRWLGAENVDITTTGIKYLTAKQTDDYVRFYSNSAGATISIDATSTNLELVATGAVSDYDLAFANPTQSLMVQDRAGAADGTSSATGVVQVTPIEQLNSKSARIGTSAATPADGELLVSGNVGVGGSPTSLLTVRDDNAFGGADNQIVAQFSPSVTLNEHAGIAFGTYGGTDDYLKTGIFWKRTGNYGVGDLIFANNGTADTSTVSSTNARLTIDSAGKIAIGNNIPMWSGSYGGALVLKGNDATADRYAQLGIVDSNGALVKDGLIVDTNGQAGLGVTPETDWDSAHSALQIGLTGSIVSGTALTGWTQVMKNARYVGGGVYKYITTDEASSYQQRDDGSHVFAVAASGTADAAITWTTPLTIHSDGEVVIGSTDQGVCMHGNTTGTASVRALNAARNTYKKLEFNALDYDFQTSSTPRLTISAAGLATFANGGVEINGSAGLNISQSAANGSVQHLSGSTTCLDNVITEVAFVSHSNLFTVQAFAWVANDKNGGAKFDFGTSFGSATITRTFQHTSTEVTDISCDYQNTGGSTSYLLRIKVDLATAASCTVHWTISGHSIETIYAI